MSLLPESLLQIVCQYLTVADVQSVIRITKIDDLKYSQPIKLKPARLRRLTSASVRQQFKHRKRYDYSKIQSLKIRDLLLLLHVNKKLTELEVTGMDFKFIVYDPHDFGKIINILGNLETLKVSCHHMLFYGLPKLRNLILRNITDITKIPQFFPGLQYLEMEITEKTNLDTPIKVRQMKIRLNPNDIRSIENLHAESLEVVLTTCIPLGEYEVGLGMESEDETETKRKPKAGTGKNTLKISELVTYLKIYWDLENLSNSDNLNVIAGPKLKRVLLDGDIFTTAPADCIEYFSRCEDKKQELTDITYRDYMDLYNSRQFYNMHRYKSITDITGDLPYGIYYLSPKFLHVTDYNLPSYTGITYKNVKLTKLDLLTLNKVETHGTDIHIYDQRPEAKNKTLHLNIIHTIDEIHLFGITGTVRIDCHSSEHRTSVIVHQDRRLVSIKTLSGDPRIIWDQPTKREKSF